MKKKLLAALLCVAMVGTLLVGCSGSSEEGSDTSESTEEATDSSSANATGDAADAADVVSPTKEGDWMIGFSNYDAGNSWRQQMEAEFRQEAEALKEVRRVEQMVPEEEDYSQYFDFEADDKDPDYREIFVSYDQEDDVFVLEGKQLDKIFRSTNFNDIGSLRYLYKYIEGKGAIEKLKELGLQEGDMIRINDYDMEYWEE